MDEDRRQKVPIDNECLQKEQEKAETVAELKMQKVFDENYRKTLKELTRLYKESGKVEYKNRIDFMQREVKAIHEARYNYFNGRGLFG